MFSEKILEIILKEVRATLFKGKKNYTCYKAP